MKIEKPQRKTGIRIAVQLLFLVIFFFLFFFSTGSTEFFFLIDPLPLISNFISTGEILNFFLISLALIVLTFLGGRFFCGWICPLGTINHFFPWISKNENRIKEGPPRKLLRIKYLLLLFLLLLSLGGIQLWGWFDPFSLLTRGIASITSPFNLFNSMPDSLNSDVSAFYRSSKYSYLPFLTGGFLVFILGMNFFHRRFFCNVLCPLGALYGIIAKYGLFKFRVTDTCNSCKACAKNCTYNGNPDDEFIKSECIVCFNCQTDCPTNSVEFGYKNEIARADKKIDLGRRRLIGSAVTGLVFTVLMKSSITGKDKKRRSFMRPPGSINETNFIDKCARCGQCVQSCPTGFIQPAFLQAGIEGLWTPILNAQTGCCVFECKKCTEVCPTKAITRLSFNEKKVFKMGTAKINRNLCYTYADGFNCTVCADKCPNEYKAIHFRDKELIDYRGQKVIVKQIFVNPDLCTGCGICEYVCPRNDAPGIFITAEDEQREQITGMI